MYMPTLARFTARDPLPTDSPLLLSRIAPYVYADNTPSRYTDPSGESPIDPFRDLPIKFEIPDVLESFCKTNCGGFCLSARNFKLADCEITKFKYISGRPASTCKRLRYTGCNELRDAIDELTDDDGNLSYENCDGDDCECADPFLTFGENARYTQRFEDETITIPTGPGGLIKCKVQISGFIKLTADKGFEVSCCEKPCDKPSPV